MSKIKISDLYQKQTLKEERGLRSKLEDIAKKNLGIKTLKTQNRDSQDFHDLAVWKIESALKAAYKLGKQSKEQETKQDEEK